MTDCERIVVAIQTEHDRVYRCNAELRDENADLRDDNADLRKQLKRRDAHIAFLETQKEADERIIATLKRAVGWHD